MAHLTVNYGSFVGTHLSGIYGAFVGNLGLIFRYTFFLKARLCWETIFIIGSKTILSDSVKHAPTPCGK